MTMKNISIAIFSFVLGMVFVSCQPKPDYYSIQYPESWESDEVLIFDNLNIDESSQVILGIDHTEDYKYENLYIKTQLIQKSDTILSELISVQLLGPNGKWIGKKDGKSRIVTVPLTIHRGFSSDEKMHLEVHQYSRERVLDGIVSIRCEISK